MRINCGKSLFSPLVLTSVESQGTNALEWEERDLESECVSLCLEIPVPNRNQPQTRINGKKTFLFLLFLLWLLQLSSAE